jgi:hypothetical protein
MTVYGRDRKFSPFGARGYRVVCHHPVLVLAVITQESARRVREDFVGLGEIIKFLVPESTGWAVGNSAEGGNSLDSNKSNLSPIGRKVKSRERRNKRRLRKFELVNLWIWVVQ